MSGKPEPFSWKKVAVSFRYAFGGIATFVKAERNLKVHIGVALCVVVAGVLLRLTALEWTPLVICIGMVISAEIFNSALEAICDKVSPEIHPLVKKAKDLGAAAVLVLAFASVIVGILIFLPHLLSFFSA